MSVSRDFEAYVVEQLESAGRVRARRMFGGVGLYIDEVFCALIGADSSRLFLRVDDSTRSDYEAEGAEPFRPYRDRDTTMSYHSVPDHILEDRDPARLGTPHKWLSGAVPLHPA